MSTALTLSNQTLDRYMQEVNRFPVLDREQELELARRLRNHDDVAAAHELVVSNLRFVVKIAHEYRAYGVPLVDLIQEGNIGLMHAVRKFNPDRGYRLITYAVWWIRAQMQSFILKTWSVVKLGSGRLARRLFFKLRSTRSAVEQETHGGPAGEVSNQVARRLGVPAEQVTDMEARLAARDFHLDAPVSESGASSHLDLVASEDPDPEARASEQQEREMIERALEQVVPGLDDKERYILEHRLLGDDPEKLADVGERFGVTRQRIQQIERRLLAKIRDHALSATPARPRLGIRCA